MRVGIVLCCWMGACFAADPKPAPAPEKTAPTLAEIPAGAVALESGSYRFTDPDGVNWLLRRSPFGIMAVPEKSIEADLRALPAGAVKLDSGSYRFTDPDGVDWLLRRSPFGVIARQEKFVEAATRVLEDGESVRFVQSTPFGSSTWERKKSELNASERAIWEQQRDRNNAK